MNKEELKKDLETILDTDTILCVSTKGVAMQGDTPDLLTLYSALTKEMLSLKGNNKDLLRNAFEMAFMSKDELVELFKKEMLEFVDKLTGKKDDKKEDKTTE